jgi:hypothetical protein
MLPCLTPNFSTLPAKTPYPGYFTCLSILVIEITVVRGIGHYDHERDKEIPWHGRTPMAWDSGDTVAGEIPDDPAR